MFLMFHCYVSLPESFVGIDFFQETPTKAAKSLAIFLAGQFDTLKWEARIIQHKLMVHYGWWKNSQTTMWDGAKTL